MVTRDHDAWPHHATVRAGLGVAGRFSSCVGRVAIIDAITPAAMISAISTGYEVTVAQLFLAPVALAAVARGMRAAAIISAVTMLLGFLQM